MEDNKRKQVMPNHNSATSERVRAKFLGNIHGSHLHDGYSGAVFDISGMCPTINTCSGGGKEPHLLIVRKL